MQVFDIFILCVTFLDRRNINNAWTCSHTSFSPLLKLWLTVTNGERILIIEVLRGVRLFESQTNDFDGWIVIRGKRTCPLTRCGHFLKCPLIRDFTTFVSFPLSRVWPAISAVFLERLLYLSFLLPKQFCLCDMVDSEWYGTGEISHYFAYQTAKLFTGNKITYTISFYL